jgi:hypothetical protein
MFLQKILPESGAKKVLACAFGGQKEHPKKIRVLIEI